MNGFDVKLIPEFDGSPTGPSIVEWFEKAERVCRLSKIKAPAEVIPLRLTGGAYAVYQQLKDEADLDEIKHALYTAFGMDESLAWKQFIGRRLCPGETVDVYLADLRKLSVAFGGVSDRVLGCAFMEGLPEDVSRLMRASSKPGEMGIDQQLARARTIVKEAEHAAAAARVEQTPSKSESVADDFRGLKCYKCGGPNHFSRECRSRSDAGVTSRNKPRCYRCNKLGHIARNCPGNGSGDRVLSPPLSPSSQ